MRVTKIVNWQGKRSGSDISRTIPDFAPRAKPWMISGAFEELYKDITSNKLPGIRKVEDW